MHILYIQVYTYTNRRGQTFAQQWHFVIHFHRRRSDLNLTPALGIETDSVQNLRYRHSGGGKDTSEARRTQGMVAQHIAFHEWWANEWMNEWTDRRMDKMIKRTMWTCRNRSARQQSSYICSPTYSYIYINRRLFIGLWSDAKTAQIERIRIHMHVL